MCDRPLCAEMTRAAETHEVVKRIGLQVPVNAKLFKWPDVMDARALAQFRLSTPAGLATMPVSFTGSRAGLLPGRTVVAGWPSFPIGIFGSSQILGLKPFHAARIGAKTVAFGHRRKLPFKLLPARLAGASCPHLTMRQRLPLLRAAITPKTDRLTSRRAGLFPIRSLLSCYGKLRITGHASCNRRTFAGACHMSNIQFSHYPDHAPENCDPANLHLNCQRCHLAVDAAHRKALREATA